MSGYQGKHRPVVGGCEHRWRNRQTVVVQRCMYWEGWKDAQTFAAVLRTDQDNDLKWRLAADSRPEQPRVTHGRHCPCSSCRREDWTRPELAHCGMHGPSCPPVYAPIPDSRPEQPAPLDVERLRLALRNLKAEVLREGWPSGWEPVRPGTLVAEYDRLAAAVPVRPEEPPE